MIIFGELLLVIGTILMIVPCYMVGLEIGLLVTGVAVIIWGMILLKLASIHQAGRGDK